VEWLRRQDDVADVESFGERLHVTLRGGATAEEAGQRLAQALTAQGVTVESVRAVPPTLEDVFISRIRDDAPRPHDEVAP
jgi:ribosomal protein S11